MRLDTIKKYAPFLRSLWKNISNTPHALDHLDTGFV